MPVPHCMIENLFVPSFLMDRLGKIPPGHMAGSCGICEFVTQLLNYGLLEYFLFLVSDIPNETLGSDRNLHFTFLYC